jgi:hypothetical protein
MRVKRCPNNLKKRHRLAAGARQALGKEEGMVKSGTSKPPIGGGRERHPLVGRGLHYKDERGCVVNQAKILAIVASSNPGVGDLALIQYFEWMGGDPSTQRLLPLTELTVSSGSGAAGSERWVFYENVEDMNDHYERIDARRNEYLRRSSNADEPAKAAP